jgi:predicted RNA methylase
MTGTVTTISPPRAAITIRHTHQDGTLVYGTEKGDGVYELIGPRTTARFRFFPSIKRIGLAQSRDHLANRYQIDAARKALETAGFEVNVEIDDTPRDAGDVKADRAERLDTRYERLTAKAERNLAEAEARRARADELESGRSPIRAGHHSERHARAVRKRVDQNDRAADAALSEAERASRAAAVVGDADAYRERPSVIRRRIDKTQAEIRILPKRWTDHVLWQVVRKQEPDPAYKEELEARRVFLEHQLEADRAALAAHVANGYVLLTCDSLHKGDTVTWSTRFGENAVVTRVNPKTVTLNRDRWPRILPYEQIKTVDCPHQGATVTVRAPRRERRPRPAPVTIDRLPVREAPLVVDGSAEYYPTPADVAELMIDMAGLEAGMTVLEPSAGLGAIAAKAAPLVASVHCIERDWQLAERLRATGIGDVRCADFLEVPPEPYDRVLMNPPFGDGADLRHVLHAELFLKPGGRLLSVMAAGVEFRQDRKWAAFRSLVEGRGGWITRLPDDSFKQAGTGVGTVIVVIPARDTQ